VDRPLFSGGAPGLGDHRLHCRIGERCFVLKYLLGVPKVRNDDGSWAEEGNPVGGPWKVLKPDTRGPNPPGILAGSGWA
jgi:hypothetical protein